jgi:hypothetical protein
MTWPNEELELGPRFRYLEIEILSPIFAILIMFL